MYKYFCAGEDWRKWSDANIWTVAQHLKVLWQPILKLEGSGEGDYHDYKGGIFKYKLVLGF